MSAENSAQEFPLAGRRILIFLRDLAMGGAERQALLLARLLREKEKAEAVVWSFFASGGLDSILDRQGIPRLVYTPVMGGSKIKRLINLAGLVRRIRRFRPHVILPFTDFPNKVLGALWPWTGAAACVWNQRDEGREVTGKLLERLALRRVSAFVANSGAGKEFLTGTFGVDPERVHIIHNGIRLPEPALERRRWRQQLGIDEETVAAVMVANLHRYKDHYTLLHAWQRVMRQPGVSPAVLLLAGRFCSTYESLKDLAGQLNIRASVRFLDQVEDISGLLGAADIGILSSMYEGLPNGILESMAAGLPVVATDIIGSREALGEDYPCLAPPEDADRLADFILSLINDGDLRRRLGRRNRQRVETRFTPELMVSHYGRLIAGLLENS